MKPINKNEELFHVTSMFHTFLKEISKDWNKHGYHLTLTQFKILYLLKLEGPKKVSQLAEVLSLTSSAVTGITDQLLKEGYIEKERAENDRRVVNISLSDKGYSTIEEKQKKQKEIMNTYFHLLNEEDVQHLKRIFTTLIDNVKKKEKQE
ncbi:MarR family transcriptional regulator [Shimazuella alba]|uniref:MarR family winged helix-turn-helix transcriptional regulator n=1 Tax=Shimazuella alba TaxID=2690964 RepID=UPI0030844257